MTPREATEAWLTRNGLQLIVYVVLIVMAWMSLSAAVGQKADKSEVTELRHDIQDLRRMIGRMDSSQRRIERALLGCGKNPNLFGCQ